MTRGQPARPCHHPPPGEARSGANEVADGAGRSWKSGLLGNFAVGHDLAGLETFQHGRDLLAEILQGFLIVKS